MSGVLTARFEDAWSAGRWDEAEALRQRLEATPRDSHSHCDACGRSQFAGYFAETGREADAVRLVEEMIEGGFRCGEEPEHALSRSLPTGRSSDVRDLSRQSAGCRVPQARSVRRHQAWLDSAPQACAPEQMWEQCRALLWVRQAQ